MGRGSMGGCRSASHQQFKDEATTRVDDLQGMFTDLQSARMESRTGDVAVLEEQVNQMLREWKAQLNEASPASSVFGNGHVSLDLSSEIGRLLQLSEEQDDAMSKLAELPPMSPKPELLEALGPDVRDMHVGGTAVYQEGNNHSSDLSSVICRLLQCYDEDVTSKLAYLLPTNSKPEPLDVSEPDIKCVQGGGNVFHEDYYLDQELPEHGFLGAGQYQSSLTTESHHVAVNCMEGITHLDYQQFNLHHELPLNQYLGFDTSGQNGGNGVPHISDLLPTICPPASAFLRPKCALWDCPRPAQGTEWCQDYCSSFHATLASNEGLPGMTPVVRPGGIDLKDGPLFAALSAKAQGKNIGIPECEGAATQQCPWNAHDLFDLLVLEGETLREWLFFDKPRRAFESGNRKQRSLPDYNGRGWHESRKQVMKEFGGLKRSYYMDPQPSDKSEWHLYEYEIHNYDACALYRLEYKLVEAKRSAKAKITSDSLVDLQQQMGRLNAENSGENKRHVKGRARANPKDSPENIYSALDIVHREDARNVYHASNQMAPMNENSAYGPSLPYIYSVESLSNYYGT